MSLARVWKFGHAAIAAGVDRGTGLEWRKDKNDADFLAAVEAARQLCVERWEEEFARRGFEGVEKPVYQGGRMVGTVIEYDTVAGIVMLKGACPEKYRERYEHTGAGGGPIELLARASSEVESKIAHLSSRLEQLTNRLPQGKAGALPELPALPVEASK